MRLRTLDCFQKIREMMLEGQSLADIAAFIQDEQGEYSDVGRASLIRTLHRYRQSVPPGELVAARLPKKHAEALKEVAKGVDELAELRVIYDMQMERVKKILPVEAKMQNVLFPNLSGEMRVLLEILREVTAVKKARGLHELPAPGAGEESGTQASAPVPAVAVLERSYGPAASSVLKNPESVHRVMSIFRTLTVMAEFKSEGSQGT